MCEESCWYKEGLRFSCTGCGKCCSGPPGYVWVTPEEMSIMALYLSIPLELFVQRYIRQVGDRFALTEIKRRSYEGVARLAAPSYDCVFLQDCKCVVYEVRPRQCKTFPWWRENLVSEESWAEAAESCEGIGKGELISYETIQRHLDGSK